MRTVLHNGVVCFPIPHLIFPGQRYSLFVLKLRMKGKLIERHILYCITEHLIFFFNFFFGKTGGRKTACYLGDSVFRCKIKTLA